MTCFCAYWDFNYLAKGMALISSLIEHEDAPRIFVLACDDLTEAYLRDRDYPFLNVLTLHDIVDDELLAAKENRSYIEWLWTLKPYLPLYCLREYEDIKAITFIDADIYLFHSLDPLYEEIGEADIAVTPHRWTPKYEERLRPNGIYNVGWFYFKNSPQAILCSENWAAQCLEWCYRTPTEDGKMAEQGYLNEWPEKFGAHVVQHLGANLAPWNQEQYSYTTTPTGKILVNGQPLLFYHYHEMRFRDNGYPARRTGYPLNYFMINHIYRPYEKKILLLTEEINRWRAQHGI